jgi:hypothetical protein
MKTVVASAMSLFLASVAALCSSVACPLTTASHAHSGSCCHKPEPHPGPCPTKTVPDCPYTILEKSKTSPSVTHAQWAVSVVRAGHSAVLPIAAPEARVPSRTADAGGLFLRNRVLLI